MTTSPLLLRVASGLALAQFVAHTSMLLSYSPKHGPDEAAVVEAMRSHLFSFGGFASHSYWDLYIGYGLMAALNCVVEAILFWQLAGMDKDAAFRTTPLIGLFCIANLAYAALVGRYFFFLPPIVFDLMIAVCLGLAIIAPHPKSSMPNQTELQSS